MCWKKARQDIGERFPEESKRKFRQRVLTERQTLAFVFTACLRELTPEVGEVTNTPRPTPAPTPAKQKIQARQNAKAALAQWVEEWGKKAEDGTYCPSLQVTMTDEWLLQFISEILPGVNEYFLCRQRNCLVLTRNTDWLHNGPVGCQYLCSQCGELYRPWVQNPNYVKCNKVVFVFSSTEIKQKKPAT